MALEGTLLSIKNPELRFRAMNSVEENRKEFISKDLGNDDDDVPQLSAEAMRALQEFYTESEAKPDSSEVEENWVFT